MSSPQTARLERQIHRCTKISSLISLSMLTFACTTFGKYPEFRELIHAKIDTSGFAKGGASKKVRFSKIDTGNESRTKTKH